MQTLWTRLASRGVCRCPQCLHVPPGVTRRTANSTTNSIPRYWTSSTLWLSGTFATAATFDAVVKQHRREQWDAAIADIKQELGSAEQENKQPQGMDEPLALANPLLDSNLDIFRFVRPGRSAATCPENSGLPLQTNCLPPQSIYIEPQQPSDSLRRRWTPKKMETMMLSMDILQLTILLDLNVRDMIEEAVSAVPADYTNILQIPRDKLREMQLSKISQLKGVQKNQNSGLSFGYQRPLDDMPLCRYTEDQHGDYRRVTNDLNRALQGLFDSYFSSTISKPTLLARLAYNLSLSTAAPNIDTYNTLLLGFSRSHPYLMKATIQSLNGTRVRPNEITDETMLRFYTKTNERKLFIKYFETMRGKHGGQCLARPDIIVNEAGKSRLLPLEKYSHKVIQLPYPTPTVFAAVIEGLLNFGRFDTALDICRQMQSEGWGICMRGLFPLLQSCVDGNNWKAGLAVWNQVQALQKQSPPPRKNEQEPTSLQMYALMLRLCRQCKQQETYDTIWKEATHYHGLKLETLVKTIGIIDERKPKTNPIDESALLSSLAEPQRSDSASNSNPEESAPGESELQTASQTSSLPRRLAPKFPKPQVTMANRPIFPHFWGSEAPLWQGDARAG